MNLYLLLAIAFGAITGAAEARVVRPSVAGVVARGEARAECGRPARIRRASRPATIAVGRDARPMRARRPHSTPSSPRAPATIG